MDYKEEIRKILKEDNTIPPEQREKLEEILLAAEKCEDERIREELLEHCKNQAEPYIQTGNKCPQIQSWITWLEKQGQEDPCKDCKHPMLNCHNFPCSKKQKYQGKSALEAAKEKKIDNSNKVEPKFHEGDFIRHNKANIIYKVISVNSSFYYIENIETSVRIGLFGVEQNFHLWTIADAKDGDVLDANGAPFIYKKHDKDYVYFYCGINLTDEFVEANGIDTWNNNNKVYPATKEQRKLLFSKMKEAGYEWDSEKKELRKIEQKLAEKVEPRFKVGDWITNGDYTWKVVEVKPLDYILQSQDGSTVDDTISYVDGQFHRYCSFCEDVEIETTKIPFGAKDSELIETTYFIPEGFHAEIVDNKVIIKKGKQRPTEKVGQNIFWSKEDEERTKNILGVLDVQVCWDGATLKKMNPYQKEIDWLQSLKNRIVPQTKDVTICKRNK